MLYRQVNPKVTEVQHFSTAVNYYVKLLPFIFMITLMELCWAPNKVKRCNEGITEISYHIKLGRKLVRLFSNWNYVNASYLKTFF